MKNLIIIGDSGHKKVVQDVAISLGYSIKGIIDDKYTSYYLKNSVLYGNTSHIKKMMKETDAKLFFGIGNNLVRKKIINTQSLSHKDFVSLISNKAIVSSSTIIGTGTLVMPNAVLNAEAYIGNHVIINTSSVIEHDCVIEDFTHISPGAILTGGVKVREGVHIGSGAVVNPLVEIDKWTVIGSGSTVIRDIGEHVTAVGSPARIIKRNMEG